MMSSAADEQVLAVRTVAVRNAGIGQGLTFGAGDTIRLINDHSEFVPRVRAENDVDFKQLIPYCVLRYGDLVFTYQRSDRSEEDRLRGRRSVGIGGHICSLDAASARERPLMEGLMRELGEEVVIATPFSIRVCALLNDDSDEVGRVHLGVVAVVSLAGSDVVARDTSLVDCQFMSLTTLRERRSEFESWSRVCIDGINHLV